jgi:peptide chain release factor 3
MGADHARQLAGADFDTAQEECALLSADGADFDLESFLAGHTTPVLFTSAILNFGVSQLLDALIEHAPAPQAPVDATGHRRRVDGPFSAFVFKVQAGMDTAHRDRVAFARVCSGAFRRGDVVTHAASRRPFTTKYAQSVFGQQRNSLETAYPGDVIGLVNATTLRVGDTLYVDEPVEYPAIPSFAPEHFAVARAADTSKHKQFRRGITQLEQEGVIQVLRSDLRGDQAPVLAAVGPMQFEVTSHRMAGELSAPIRLEHLNYTVARRARPKDVEFLQAQRGVEVLTRTDGALLALFSDKWWLDTIVRNNPGLVLERLIAAAE